MAWQARLTQDLYLDSDNRLVVAVDYFDDAAPNTVLHSKTWTVDPDLPLAKLRTAVIAEGQSSRAAYTQLVSLRGTLPVGTTVAIP